MKSNKIVGTKIGNIVNLVIDGNAFQKTFESQDEANAFYKLMHEARNGDAQALENLMGELNRRYKTVIKGILEKDGDDNYFLKGIDIAMPKLLADTFVDYLENDFPVNALVNFWKLLVSNPDTRVREDLFQFLQNFNFSITDNGYFIAYKALEVKEAAQLDIAAFVSNQYLKIKKWKKNVNNYNVVKVTFTTTETVMVDVPNPAYEEYDEEWNEETEEYEDGGNNGEPEYIQEPQPKSVTLQDLRLVQVGHTFSPDEINSTDEYEVIGNLGELFKNIDQFINNRTIYQSKYSGVNGKIEQVLGVPVKQERSLTNSDPREECSEGLHVGSVRYVERFGSNPTDKILLVLVNPAHVVAVPPYENSKMRTCEYFPYAELDRNPDGTFEVVESFQDRLLRISCNHLRSTVAESKRFKAQSKQHSKAQTSRQRINLTTRKSSKIA